MPASAPASRNFNFASLSSNARRTGGAASSGIFTAPSSRHRGYAAFPDLHCPTCAVDFTVPSYARSARSSAVNSLQGVLVAGQNRTILKFSAHCCLRISRRAERVDPREDPTPQPVTGHDLSLRASHRRASPHARGHHSHAACASPQRRPRFPSQSRLVDLNSLPDRPGSGMKDGVHILGPGDRQDQRLHD